MAIKNNKYNHDLTKNEKAILDAFRKSFKGDELNMKVFEEFIGNIVHHKSSPIEVKENKTQSSTVTLNGEISNNGTIKVINRNRNNNKIIAFYNSNGEEVGYILTDGTYGGKNAHVISGGDFDISTLYDVFVRNDKLIDPTTGKIRENLLNKIDYATISSDVISTVNSILDSKNYESSLEWEEL